MKHTRGLEAGREHEILAKLLGDLNPALVRLDREAIENLGSDLEELAPKWKQLIRALNAEQAAALREQVQKTRRLAVGARGLFGGVSRLVARQGAAYTPNGAEPEPGAANSLIVQG